MLNSLSRDDEFLDGQVKDYSDIFVAENILPTVLINGLLMTIIKFITCYVKNNSAVGIANKHAITPK